MADRIRLDIELIFFLFIRVFLLFYAFEYDMLEILDLLDFIIDDRDVSIESEVKLRIVYALFADSDDEEVENIDKRQV
jgi:hypothetical protein